MDKNTIYYGNTTFNALSMLQMAATRSFISHFFLFSSVCWPRFTISLLCEFFSLRFSHLCMHLTIFAIFINKWKHEYETLAAHFILLFPLQNAPLFPLVCLSHLPFKRTNDDTNLLQMEKRVYFVFDFFISLWHSQKHLQRNCTNTESHFFWHTFA